MARVVTVRAVWGRVRAFALGLPDAVEEFPWGEPVAKVRKKVFIFMGNGEGKDAAISVKLDGDAHGHALSLNGARPTAYNLGKSGWVTIPLAALAAHPDLMFEWVEMSYCLVAPKKLGASVLSARR